MQWVAGWGDMRVHSSNSEPDQWSPRERERGRAAAMTVPYLDPVDMLFAVSRDDEADYRVTARLG